MTHRLAGTRSTADLSELLGLARSRAGWTLGSLCAEGGAKVRLGLRKDSLRLVIHLLPKGAPNAVLETGGLAMAAEGTPGPAQKRLLCALAAKLGARTLEDVLGLIEADPETFGEPAVDVTRSDALRVPLAAGPINLLGAGWRNFFADQDFEVMLGSPELSGNKTVYARYSDRECLYSWSCNDPRKWSFFDYPVRAPSEISGSPVFRTGVVMELEERDMVLGAEEKTGALIDSVTREAAASGAEFVVFNHFCTPIIMGDDAGAVLRRLEEAGGLKAVYWSQVDRDQLNNFGEHFRALFSAPRFFDAPPDPAAVNLFHFPTDFREAELVPLLARMGVRVASRQFPDVDFPSMGDIPRAAAHVFCAATSYQSKLRELLAAGPRPTLTARAPYGIGDTGECLKAIAAAAGREKAFEEVWSKELARVLPVWSDLKDRARGERLAFVVSEATLPMLWALRHGQGAPMMRMIEEMGFGVDILCFDPHDERPRLACESRLAAITPFRTPRELARALREGAFGAVYSDIFFDRRISAAGKARFSSKDFEMGLDGALRSFRRLLALTRLPFYRRYGGHLDALDRRDRA